MAHPVYDMQAINEVKYTHREPQKLKDKLACNTVKFARAFVDKLTAYDPQKMDERAWLNRMIFLETVAGVPGMIGGMSRHLRSLRTLERDHGWIHHLLQEAENERMHLFFFLSMRNPGIAFRTLIALTQGLFFNGYFLFYMISPSLCHRFVGYLEEEAVHTYSILIDMLDKEGQLPNWENAKAPQEAIDYYTLDSDTATFRDFILAVRADEACHREVNHHFADIPSYQPVDFEVVEVYCDERKERTIKIGSEADFDRKAFAEK